MRFRAAMLAACVHAHGTLEYPPSRAMGVGSTGTDLDSWTSSSVCGEPYGSCYWFTELVGINGLGPFPAEGHVPATQTPAYAPGTAPIEGSGCGAAGGGPTNNYPRAGTARAQDVYAGTGRGHSPTDFTVDPANVEGGRHGGRRFRNQRRS